MSVQLATMVPLSNLFSNYYSARKKKTLHRFPVLLCSVDKDHFKARLLGIIEFTYTEAKITFGTFLAN